MKRGLIGLQLSLGRPSTKHLLNPSQGLTGTLLGISTFDNGIFYYNSLMETLVQRTFLPFLSIDHELYKDGSWRSRRNVQSALGCSRFFSSCVFLHCHSAVPSAVKRWKKQLTEEHPQGNTSSAMLVRKLFSKHLLGFILLQLGQPAAKGHIQSDVDVLRKTSAAGMQPACHFAKFQPVFHVPLLSYPLPDECSFRIILKGQQLTFVRTKQSSAEQRLVFRYCTAQPHRGRDCRDRAVPSVVSL